MLEIEIHLRGRGFIKRFLPSFLFIDERVFLGVQRNRFMKDLSELIRS